jgi:hypothetical protein
MLAKTGFEKPITPKLYLLSNKMQKSSFSSREYIKVFSVIIYRLASKEK